MVHSTTIVYENGDIAILTLLFQRVMYRKFGHIVIEFCHDLFGKIGAMDGHVDWV
jgi:hypothetical protein